MLFEELVSTSARVAESSSRLAKVALLADLLRRLGPHEIDAAVAFLAGETRQGRLGVGPAAVWNGTLPAPSSAATLHLVDVDEAFERISRTSGSGSSLERTEILQGLWRRATSHEQDFLARLVMGELRQGALEGVLVEAVARASGVSASSVRRATMMAGRLARVAQAALADGEAGLSRFAVQIFHPVQPMLAQPADGLAAALDELAGEMVLEWKLDGARIQAHKSGDEVRVFSRNLRDVSDAVPEVVEAVRGIHAREAILDGEVIALRPDGSPHPFQTTMQRFGRKLDVDALRKELPLTPFFFDCLAFDGEPLIDRPQIDRYAVLASAAPGLIVPNCVRPTPATADQFLEETLARGHEGVMAKALGATYAAGRRGQNWLKIKVARTLDLVVLAAEWGHGRRRGWLSNLHLGARDPARGSFVMLGKTFKGLTDRMLAWQTEKLLALEISRTDYTVFVKPELVVEIAFNDVQGSPHYPGGVALRFARVKAYRPDKSAAEADTIDTVREIHRGSARA
jgi:DNA ligase-1